MPNDPLRLDPKARCQHLHIDDYRETAKADSDDVYHDSVHCADCGKWLTRLTKERPSHVRMSSIPALPVPTSEEPRITVGHRRAIGVVEAGIAGPMDWPEDFAHENGRYFNACHSCACIFVGHKRRVICRVCSAPIPPIMEDVERAVEEHGEACYEVGFADADRDLREAPVARRNAARAHLLSLFPSGGTVPPAVPEAETGDAVDARRWRTLRPFLETEEDGDGDGSWVDLRLIDDNTGEESVEITPPTGISNPDSFVDVLAKHPERRIGYTAALPSLSGGPKDG